MIMIRIIMVLIIITKWKAFEAIVTERIDNADD
jgi:hypothetical protein